MKLEKKVRFQIYRFNLLKENTGVVAETKAIHSKEGIASNSKKDLSGDKVNSKTRKHRNTTRQFIENQSDIISTSKFNSTFVNTIEPNTAGSLQNESGANALLSVALSENTEDNSISKAATLLGSVISTTTKMPKRIKKYEYEDDGCNIFKNDRKRYYLDLYYSPELTSKSITAKIQYIKNMPILEQVMRNLLCPIVWELEEVLYLEMAWL